MAPLPVDPRITGYFGGILDTNQREKLDLRMAEADSLPGRLPCRPGAGLGGGDRRQSGPASVFAIAGGRAAFSDNCTPCHALGGAGAGGRLPGLLADDDCCGAARLDAIQHTISYGVRHEPAQTRYSEMPAFGQLGILSREDVGPRSPTMSCPCRVPRRAEATPEGRGTLSQPVLRLPWRERRGNERTPARRTSVGPGVGSTARRLCLE